MRAYVSIAFNPRSSEVTLAAFHEDITFCRFRVIHMILQMTRKKLGINCNEVAIAAPEGVTFSPI